MESMDVEAEQGAKEGNTMDMNWMMPEGERRIKLLPCPFCGVKGHTYLRRWPGGEQSPSMMMFHKDTCVLEHVIEAFDEYPDEQALADAWNTRFERKD